MDNFDDKSRSSYIVTRWLFLRLLGLVYLSAFGSLAFQIIGLNGSHGIQPTETLLEGLHEVYGDSSYWLLPTIEWLNCSDLALQWITWLGIALSICVIFGVVTAPVLVMLGILWLSFINGGGEFSAFQSDGMLVEVTILSLFFAPWQWFEPPWPVRRAWVRQHEPPAASLSLLRFMVFRLMLASGLVKILSGDETWANLTAMNYHFETQPIPTPLAWYAHWLPEWIHKVFVIGMWLSELIAPLLIFAGRYPRIIAACLIFVLHLMIALTGNYTYLNYLTMILCLPLLDDRVVSNVVPRAIVKTIQDAQENTISSGLRNKIINALACVLLFIAGCQLASSVIRVPDPVRLLLASIESYRIAEPYGLFAVMTRTRPEIVFQGSSDGKTWLSYEFKYKVGDDLRRAPPLIAPHMPRLDWRLWFAAMEPVESNPWVLGIVRHLLDGSGEIQEFFVRNPFPAHPPAQVRAFVYDYHFESPDQKSRTGNWWRRDNKQIYLPALALKDGQLVKMTEREDMSSDETVHPDW